MKFKKSIRSLLVSALVLVMILSFSAVPAMASQGASTEGNNPLLFPATTVAASELPVSVITQNRMLTLTRYEWNATLRRNVAIYELHPASKIEMVMEYIYPAHRLQEETAVLQRLNDRYTALKGYVYSGQTQPLWNYLSWQTQSLINSSMDAEEALKVIRAQADYRNNSYVKWYVDTYLNSSLHNGMSQVASCLSKIYMLENPDFMQAVKISSARELLDIANQTIATNEYQAFMRAMAPFRDRSHDAYSLCTFYSDAQLQQYYAALRTAGWSYPWRTYFAQLDSVTFSIPQ